VTEDIKTQIAVLMQLHIEQGLLTGEASKVTAAFLRELGCRFAAFQIANWHESVFRSPLYRDLLQSLLPRGCDAVRELMGEKPRAQALQLATKALERLLQEQLQCEDKSVTALN
jgi:hypothetical protein